MNRLRLVGALLSAIVGVILQRQLGWDVVASQRATAQHAKPVAEEWEALHCGVLAVRSGCHLASVGVRVPAD